MPVRFAVANGNWNTGATWDNGIGPVAGDTVYPNGFTVTIDTDISVASLNNNISNVYLPNMNIPKMTGNTQPSGIANASSNATTAFQAFDQINSIEWYSGVNNTGWVSYDFLTNKLIKRYYFKGGNNYPTKWTFDGWDSATSQWVTLEDKTLIVTNSLGGYLSPLLIHTTQYTMYRINVTAASNAGFPPQIQTFEMTESTATSYGATTGGSFTVPNTLSGTRNIVQTGDGIRCLTGHTGGVVNVNAISGATVNFNVQSGGYIFNPTWITAATNNTKGVAINGNCAVNFNGNIFGQTGVGIYNDTSAGQIYINAAATVTINGNIYSPPGAGGSFTYQIHLVTSTSNAAILNINGDVISSNLSGYTYPIYLNSLATVNIVGNLTSVVGYCLISTTGSTVNLTGTATVTNANSLPAIYMTQQNVTPQTSLLTINGSVTNKNNSNAIVATKIRFISTATPYWIYQTNAGTDMTLSYGTATGPYPAASDVRYNVAYGANPTVYGTLRVPLPQYVSQGVLTDNTTGTAYLSATDVWNVLTSTITTPGSVGKLVSDNLNATVSSRATQTSVDTANTNINNLPANTTTEVWNKATSGLTTSGSIGERLKNASTVQTNGDQLAAYIV